jgi:hypothetical protein
MAEEQIGRRMEETLRGWSGLTAKTRQSEIPPGLRKYADDLAKHLRDYAERTLRVFVWRIGSRDHHNPIGLYRSFGWSDDGVKWQAMPTLLRLDAEVHSILRNFPEAAGEEIAELVRKGRNEPIGHELFREAWSQRNENPRSALILSLAALEAGFKELVATLLPEAEWLVVNAPSPPIVSMLVDYLPQLPTRRRFGGHVLPPPPRVIETIRKGVGLRNSIVHGVHRPLPKDSLRAVLDAIRDVLYLLDVYSGEAWAQDHISADTQSALESMMTQA